jgi:hypothetical protein
MCWSKRYRDFTRNHLDISINLGPWNGCDESAAKGAAHDLKGLNHYFSASVPGIHFPLMTLIDYKGFRMTAQAVLPLGENSLIYGSNDAGRTVYQDVKFHEAMLVAAEKLNLRRHIVGPAGELKELYSAVDIEGHRGEDGRLYLLVRVNARLLYLSVAFILS